MKISLYTSILHCRVCVRACFTAVGLGGRAAPGAAAGRGGREPGDGRASAGAVRPASDLLPRGLRLDHSPGRGPAPGAEGLDRDARHHWLRECSAVYMLICSLGRGKFFFRAFGEEVEF